MQTYPFSIDDIVEVNGFRGKVVVLWHNVAYDIVDSITILFECGTREIFDESQFDKIEIPE